MVIVLYIFIIKPKEKVSYAFILGFCIYGIFDYTNLAIFKNYKLKTALQDQIWGSILFTLVTIIVYLIQGTPI